MVAGFIRRFSYVVVTDQMHEQFRDDELDAVLATKSRTREVITVF